MVSAEDTRLDMAQGANTLDSQEYRLMVEAATDYAIFLLDKSGFVKTWNTGAREIKGYEAAEIIGRHFSVFYPPELLERRWPEHELEMALANGRFEDEGWRIRKDGTRFWANIIINKLIDSTGNFRGFCKITRDLTERRQHEESLRLSEERFRLLVESVQDYAIFMLDPSGYVVSWNIGAELCKGYKASEVLGTHFSRFYPAEVKASGWPERELEIALQEGRSEDEGWRVRKDGSRFWASVIITALHDAAGNHRGFAKVTRDLTQKRKISLLEDEGRRITQFLAMLGHELRNPLAPISNALAVLTLEPLESQHVRSMLEIITRQTAHMGRIVDDLLDISRVTTGKVQLQIKPVRLRDVVAGAIEAAGPLIEREAHTLSVDTAADLWVSGDLTRLVQVVTNLLTNAAKFTPRGGRIDLRIRPFAAGAEIHVKDNGSGIPLELQSSVFKLFFQTSQNIERAQGGLGLGLSLVRELVSLHGGEIAVFSTGRAGDGSEFVIQLPAIAAPRAHARSTVEHDTQLKRRVLVVDDNQDAANSMGLLLKAMGYTAEVLYDGQAALDAVTTDPPDAVLLDIGLPGLSGTEVAKKIMLEIVDPPPLIAITGYSQAEDRDASRKAGFYAHLVKPIAVADLKALLKELLH